MQDPVLECRDWADKAEALASYAKMADDDSLRTMADRIQARAVRRMGELLKQFDARGGDQSKSEGDHTFADEPSRQEMAERAGISKHQRKQAVRVANVPAEKFDAAIEAELVRFKKGTLRQEQQDRQCRSWPRIELHHSRCRAIAARNPTPARRRFF